MKLRPRGLRPPLGQLRAAPRTTNRRLAALSRFFKWAAAHDLSRRDPTPGVRTLRLPARQPKALTPKEERRLRRVVEEVGNARDAAILEVLVGTGARMGVLTVRRGKGGLTRAAPLTADVRNALNACLQQIGRGLGDDDPLRQGTRGPLQDGGGICRMLEKCARWAGIEKLAPHTGLHTFATRYFEASPGDLRGLASLLGHASLNTVMIYTEPTEEDLSERVGKPGEKVSRSG